MLLRSRARIRGLASCYSHHAVKVFDSSRSSKSATAIRHASVPTSVTCLYRTKPRLSSNKHLDTYLTWSDSLPGQLDISIAVQVDDACTLAFGPLLTENKKGSGSLASADGSVVSLYWDVSSARYASGGPEPTESFYVVLLVDGEVALLLGDRCVDQEGSINLDGMPAPDVSLISRVEKVVGDTRFTSKARFKGEGKKHDICIECRNESELWVWIDKSEVVRAKRLGWNFRGNQTIFADGVPVDVMWDVHGWWFQRGEGRRAMFLFRARHGLGSGLCLEEELQQKEAAGSCSTFSLLIHACRSTTNNTTTKKPLISRRHH